MRPALAVVAARARAGEWPRPIEFRALLDESDTDSAEAESMTRAYADAVGSITSRTSGEDAVMAALRGFTLSRQ